MAEQTRSPIVTVMGHVDHGKTTLLDTIRHSKVAAGETGGITQHIGAYQVTQNKKTITFIDTPGHAAFTKMRSRGAQVTDIAILVVSATEGVKPQTVESIQHILTAKVQPIVAITKMDLPEASVDMVKAQLTEHQIFVEGYGGDVVAIPVSAKTGEGIDKLLEMISLVADMLELKADPQGKLEAVVIESEKDPHRGPIATVLVRNGTLKTGNTIWVNGIETKIRAMVDDTGKTVKEAGPSAAVVVLGWKHVPEVGSQVIPENKTEEIVKAADPEQNNTAADILPEAQQKKIKLIIKSDTAGTLEAIEQSMTEEIEIVDKGVGEVTETDVLLAEATGAKIIGFQVKVSTSVKKLAEMQGVKIKSYSIIYEFLEELQKQVLKLIEPTIDEEEVGVAEILALFEMKGDKIAGCKVKSGEITKMQMYHLRRDGKIIADPKVASLKRGKEDIDAAKTGTECGVIFRRFKEFQIGDELVAYKLKD